MLKCLSGNGLKQGQALHLDRGLFEIFRNLLLAKLSKNDTNIICRSLKKKICFPKFEDCSPKIKSATVILSLIFSRAWQSYFLCHTHAFLKNCVFFIDEQMILVSFFYISAQNSVNW